MPTFNGIPPSRKSSNRQNPISVMCEDCKRKVKDWLKNGGIHPKVCDRCAEKLKIKMQESRYPDRE